MKYLVLCVTLNILFFINTVYSGNVTIQAKYDRNSKSNHVNFVVKQSFHLSCNASEDVKVVVWKKEDKPVTEIDSVKNRIKQKNDGNTFTLTIDNAVDDDAGNYTCIAMKDSKEEARSSIRVTSNMAVKVPSNVNVVEGEKLRIHCLIIGNPPPQLSWYFQNETFNASYSESDDRVIIEDDEEKDIPNAIFILNEVDMNDRGIYRCIGRSPVTGETAHSDSMVRIKDKYAALWPFLGICAEVIILCAIIFIYEKKRNKTELEESDTDQSPDQKNTPDHGKDSNLRHRQ